MTLPPGQHAVDGFPRHPRSRVWHEERNGRLPNWLVRPVYRALRPPIAFLSRRGPR